MAEKISQYEKARIDALRELKAEMEHKLAQVRIWVKRREIYEPKLDLFSDIDSEEIDKAGHSNTFITFCERTIRELQSIIDMPTMSYTFKAQAYDKERREAACRTYDNELKKVYDAIDHLVDTAFVDEFNRTFCAEVNAFGKGIYSLLDFEFDRSKADARCEMTKKYIQSYLKDYVYELLIHGSNRGIERVNGVWTNIQDYDNMRIQQDRYKGLFLFEYKIEQLFPNDERCLRNYRHFTYLAVKINGPDSQWKTIIS